jgi:hypothetical protein
MNRSAIVRRRRRRMQTGNGWRRVRSNSRSRVRAVALAWSPRSLHPSRRGSPGRHAVPAFYPSLTHRYADESNRAWQVASNPATAGGSRLVSTPERAREPARSPETTPSAAQIACASGISSSDLSETASICAVPDRGPRSAYCASLARRVYRISDRAARLCSRSTDAPRLPRRSREPNRRSVRSGSTPVDRPSRTNAS